MSVPKKFESPGKCESMRTRISQRLICSSSGIGSSGGGLGGESALRGFRLSASVEVTYLARVRAANVVHRVVGEERIS